MGMSRERYNPRPMAADSSYEVMGGSIGGFLPTTSGTLTITSTNADGLGEITLVDAVPVTEGVYLQIPLLFPAGAGGHVTLGGGASGTLFT